VADASNMPVGVTSRSLLTAVPVRLSIDRGAWADIVTWSGPWTFDERWWDPETRHRSARFQMVLDTGAAHLVTLERGRWWIEATYD
jgi:protein ImuB